MADKLNPRQQRFVEEYLKDLNASAAYLRAGYVGSKLAAEANGARLMANPKVRAAIAAGKAERSLNTKIDAEWVLLRLADEVFADLADIIDEEGALKPIKEWPKVWRTGLVQGIDVETNLSEDGKANKVAKIRLSDRAKRLEMIGKHVDVQAWRENIGLNMSEVVIKDWRGKTGSS